MRLSALGELSLVSLIRERFSAHERGRLLRGIGDDAAVMARPGGRLLASTDIMAEGVHFRTDLITPGQLGFKLIYVNVSDIYAMSGKPTFVFLGLAFPPETTVRFVEDFLEGVGDALERYGAKLAGGDISSSVSGAVLSATVLGEAGKRTVLRSGARPGDSIYVTGTLGDSACGLELLKKIGRKVQPGKTRGPLPPKTMEPLLMRHLMPVARRPGAWHATSMMDLSDGLALDLFRLCEESGAGARLYEDSIPMSPQMKEAARKLGLDPLRLAIEGGEDYELLFTAPGTKALRGARRIGEVTRAGGILMERTDGTEMKVRPSGYAHFRPGG